MSLKISVYKGYPAGICQCLFSIDQTGPLVNKRLCASPAYFEALYIEGGRNAFIGVVVDT